MHLYKIRFVMRMHRKLTSTLATERKRFELFPHRDDIKKNIDAVREAIKRQETILLQLVPADILNQIDV